MKIDSCLTRSAYVQLCEEETDIPLFSQAWWLDAVAGDGWTAVLAYQGDKVVGALPYVWQRKWGMTLLTQPKLTQALGPWVRPSSKSYPKALAYEKDVLQALARGLPHFHYYGQNWHHTRQNWLPFYWLGFEQTTHYTYRLDRLADEEAIWDGLQENIRFDIRKARKRFQVTVRSARNLAEFLDLNKKTFERQGKRIPYTRRLVARIDAAAAAHDARDCLIAVDPDGNQHAAAYIVRNGDTAYYLIGGGDPVLRRSGATSLVLWEAIRSQPETIRFFDFEGSMIEPIERFFRAFGGTQVPYLRVTKTQSRLLQIALCVRDIFKNRR